MQNHLECSIEDCRCEALSHVVIADPVQESNTTCQSLIYYVVLEPENLEIQFGIGFPTPELKGSQVKQAAFLMVFFSRGPKLRHQSHLPLYSNLSCKVCECDSAPLVECLLFYYLILFFFLFFSTFSSSFWAYKM